jgi:VanZ family protein
MNKKYIKWFMLIVWIIIIFLFSNDPAVVSDQKSDFVISLFDFLGMDLKSIFGKIANFVVRKAAHFTEYLILYVLIYNAVKTEKISMKEHVVILFFVFLYACSDEFHQIFVPGRDGRFKDVIIDTLGGATALIFIKIGNNIKVKRNINS